MSEGLIVRKGGSSVKIKKVLKTEFILADTNWVVPNTIINNSIDVRIFGGGGAGNGNYGGCSGWMNNDIINVVPGQVIPIYIGSGGIMNSNGRRTPNTGGTTAFGNYLSANGGSYGSTGGGAGGVGGTGHQFGGGGGHSTNGGNGGMWGGGGGGGGNMTNTKRSAGHGGMYGGGGGAGISDGSCGYAGNGGMYGGGGGGSVSRWGNDSSLGGYGGQYGGNGGNPGCNISSGIMRKATRSEDGVNTLGWTNIYFDEYENCYYNGAGLGGIGEAANWTNTFLCGAWGGGGFGGNGGSTDYGNLGVFNAFTGGGGGGYGSNGGRGHWNRGGGGGGGFGGDGGNGAGIEQGAGGGGYGKAASGNHWGGGGGYYAPGAVFGGGGCGLYTFTNGRHPADGADYWWTNSGCDGICILKYLQYEIEM